MIDVEHVDTADVNDFNLTNCFVIRLFCLFFFTLRFCFNTYIYCMRVESSPQCETKSIHLITLVSTAINIRIDPTTASLVILTTRDLVCRVSRPR